MAVYLPLAVVLLGWGSVGMTMWEWSLHFAVGLLLWTFIEYAMHRFVFHAPKLMALLGGGPVHYRHHQSPAEVEFIATPLSFSLPVAAFVWVLLRLTLGTWEKTAAAMAGVILGYLVYEAVHLRIHTFSGGGAALRRLRRHHYRHHFSDPEVCFGVSTPIWDAVLQTLPRKSTHSEAASRSGVS
jgi:sterol desaturase/sphingolipid hydroxylase (fatty acid hydroxylase superfamily)